MFAVRSALLLVVFTFFLCACTPDHSPNVASSQTVREVNQGKLIGFEGEYNNHAWLGIPYATAPIGDLRWKAPQAAPKFQSDLFNALEHGAACTQYAGGLGGVPGEIGTLSGSEDCLFLSVYAPKMSQSSLTQLDKKLPVMVWVHGGANRSGAGSMYDGSRLAAEQNVIVVSINYRLGPLGWFLHPSLNHDGSPEDKSGNYGTLDIIQSLKWVQQNIAGFGGDADNVTLFGESAGGFNIYSLLLSPMAKGLFHKAISQSGGLPITTAETATNYIEQMGHKYSSQQVELYVKAKQQPNALLATIKSAQTKQTPAERAAFLRSLSLNELFSAYQQEDNGGSSRHPTIIADGLVLPIGDPETLFRDAQSHNNVPLIAGTNRDENKLYQFQNLDLVDSYFGMYFVAKDQDRYDAFAEYPSRMWKFNGVDKYAAALSQSMPGKVWAYRFDWDEQARPLGMKIDSLIGAGHGMEIPFVFGFTDKSDIWQQMYDENNQQSRESLSRTMRNYWAAFAHFGDPAKGMGGQALQWQAWQNATPTANKYIVCDSKSDGGVRMANTVETLVSIEQDLLQDNRLSDPKDKCKVFSTLVKGEDNHWPENEYANKVSGACAKYPLTLP